MIYEYREYDVTPGNMDEMCKIMNAAYPLFIKHGMKIIDITRPIVGAEQQKIVYFIGFENMEERNRIWNEFFTDEEWAKARADFKRGAAYSQFSAFLKPTKFSPLK